MKSMRGKYGRKGCLIRYKGELLVGFEEFSYIVGRKVYGKDCAMKWYGNEKIEFPEYEEVSQRERFDAFCKMAPGFVYDTETRMTYIGGGEASKEIGLSRQRINESRRYICNPSRAKSGEAFENREKMLLDLRRAREAELNRKRETANGGYQNGD